MKKKSVRELVIENILVLIPLILYGVYKNGYLIYERGLIKGIAVFKPILLVIISLVVKISLDIIKNKKFKIDIDYNLLCLILVSMIMPYNISIFVYIIGLILCYIASLILDKYFKFNKVCLIYLIIILINSFVNGFSYLNILEEKFTFSFSSVDLLMGRCVGGISSTSVILSLGIFTYLTYNFYYKKDIPIAINITYLVLSLIYFLITHNSDLFINGDLVFASVFIATIPMHSPSSVVWQIIYGIFIGLISFIISITFNMTISVYIAILMCSLLMNLRFRQNMSKTTLAK